MFPPKNINFILLVYIGGITYSEIEAIRFLNTSPEFSKYKFLIITTNIINGKTMFNEIKDDKIDLMIDENEVKKEEKEIVMDKKTLEQHKKKEKEEAKKKEKEEKAKQKAKEKQEKELAKDRAEFKKMKEKEKNKKK